MLNDDNASPPEQSNDFAHDSEEPSSWPLASLPSIEGERRKQDRRQADRQGKYDRRRNRCVHCSHFAEVDSTGKGRCTYHQVDMVAYAFACPHFEGLSPDSKK